MFGERFAIYDVLHMLTKKGHFILFLHRDLLFDDNSSIDAGKYKEEYRLALFADIMRREYITIFIIWLRRIKSNVHTRISVSNPLNRVGVRSLAPNGLPYLVAHPFGGHGCRSEGRGWTGRRQLLGASESWAVGPRVCSRLRADSRSSTAENPAGR